MKKTAILFICLGIFTESKPAESKRYGFWDFFKNAYYGIKHTTIPEGAFVIISQEKDTNDVIIELNVKTSRTNDSESTKIKQLLNSITEVGPSDKKFVTYTPHNVFTEKPCDTWNESKENSTFTSYYTNEYTRKKTHIPLLSIGIDALKIVRPRDKIAKKGQENMSPTHIHLLQKALSFTVKDPYGWDRLFLGTTFATLSIYFLNKFIFKSQAKNDGEFDK